jgi:hypothetical protein
VVECVVKLIISETHILDHSGVTLNNIISIIIVLIEYIEYTFTYYGQVIYKQILRPLLTLSHLRQMYTNSLE